MGKQVRFYMLPIDEESFLDFVLQDENIVLLARDSHKPEPRIIERHAASTEQVPELRWLLLWKSSLPLDSRDIRRVELKEYSIEQMAYVVTGEIKYRIDISNAPVIEFSRSFVSDDGILVKGRIWAAMHRLEDDHFVYKGEVFEKWYDRTARWIRRNFQRNKDLDGYFGQEALRWQQEGKPIGK